MSTTNFEITTIVAESKFWGSKSRWLLPLTQKSSAERRITGSSAYDKGANIN